MQSAVDTGLAEANPSGECASARPVSLFQASIYDRMRERSCQTWPTISFASRLDRGCREQIGRNLVRRECLDVHLDQADERRAEIRPLTAAAIHDHADANDFAAALADDLDRFLDSAAAGDDIFGDNEPFVSGNFETAPQDEPARFLFDKDMTFA